MTTDTKTRPEDTTAEPKRKFKFPTAFTVLFFVLVLVWILTFIIPPGSYSYVSCDGGSPKPIPGTFATVKQRAREGHGVPERRPRGVHPGQPGSGGLSGESRLTGPLSPSGSADFPMPRC
jgi:hypothetical protein